MSKREMMIRRKRQMVCQRITVVTLTFLIILCGVLMGNRMMADGKNSDSGKPVSVKYYTSIQIEQGDTLWSIASDYISSEYESIREYIEEVKELNHLGDDEIHTGQYLMVPYYSSELH